jgi:MFS family permease
LNTALGFMRTAGLIIAMLAQPIFGLLSDRSMSRFGRRRPYIALGVALDLIFLLLIAIAGNYWFLLIVILLQQFSANISHGAAQGLIPDLVPENQRGSASAIKSIFELIPIILLGFTVSQLVKIGRFDLAVISTAIGLLIITILTVILVKEEPLKETIKSPLAPALIRVIGIIVGIFVGAIAGLIGGALVGGLCGGIAWLISSAEIGWVIGLSVGIVLAMIIAIIVGVIVGVRLTIGKKASSMGSYTWWIINRLMFLTAITSIQGFAPFYFMFIFNIDKEEAAGLFGQLMIVVGVFTLISAFASYWLSDRIGQHRLISTSASLAGIGTGFLLISIFFPTMLWINIAGILLGVGSGLFITSNWALGTRLVPLLEAGLYLGISNLAGAGAGMIGSGMGGPLADILNKQNPGLGYFVIFLGYGILFFLSIFTLKGIKED